MVVVGSEAVVVNALPGSDITGAMTLVVLLSAISGMNLHIVDVMIIGQHDLLRLVDTDLERIPILGITGHRTDLTGGIDGDRALHMEGTGDIEAQVREPLVMTTSLTSPILEERHRMFQWSKLLLLMT